MIEEWNQTAETGGAVTAGFTTKTAEKANRLSLIEYRAARSGS
ncbi:hypothetical protein PO124_01455 [Bacillus licheniformis]|nr:hypothetical protein [Bacillus licheniformis]